MKIFTSVNLCILFISLTACSSHLTLQSTNQNSIPKITDIDLQYASQKAQQNNKTLMIVYQNDKCSTCNLWLANLLDQQQSNEMLQRFEIKSVSLQKGIDVTCPSGIELDNEEFFEAKGIEGDLSIVFHNDIGEVVFTYNEQPNNTELKKLLHYIKLEKYQDNIDYDDWHYQQS